MGFSHSMGGCNYRFDDLKTLLAKATPMRSGDGLAGVAAESEMERAAARYALADLPLKHFLSEAVVPYEPDDVTRLIFDTHDATAFAAVSHLLPSVFPTQRQIGRHKSPLLIAHIARITNLTLIPHPNYAAR